MAAPITWRNVAAPALNQASYGSSANSAFGVAGNTFREYGDFLGKTADRKATSAAVQQALQTGQVGANLSDRVDIGAVQAALGTKIENEGGRLVNIGRGHQNETFRLDGITARKDLENYDDNLELDQNLTRAQTEQARAGTKANVNAGNKSAYELTQLKTNDQLKAAGTAAQEQIDQLYNSMYNEKVAELYQDGRGGISQEEAIGQARDYAAAELGNMYSTKGLQKVLGISSKVLAQTQFGQDARATELATTKALVEQGVANGKIDQKAAASWEEATDRFVNGQDIDLLYVDDKGNFSLRTGKNVKPFKSTEVKQRLESRRQSDTGGAVDLREVEGFSEASELLTLLDPSLVERIVSNAEKHDFNDQEFIDSIRRQGQYLIKEIQKNPASFVERMNEKELTGFQKAALAVGDSSQAPSDGEGFNPSVLDEVAVNPILSAEQAEREALEATGMGPLFGRGF